MNTGYKSQILVTGASGFIASGLINRLSIDPKGYFVFASSQNFKARELYRGIQSVSVVDYPVTNLQRVDAIVHTSGLSVAKSLEHYRDVNFEYTISLAKKAAQADVRRFIFLSTIKVHGERSVENHPFTETDIPLPEGPYALSKYEAEQALLELAGESKMEVVIIRPPLVYGPKVKGNFRTMIDWIEKGIPLPLGAIDNRRSFIALDNLVDLLVRCIDHPAAANQVFLVSDNNDLSTTDLLLGIGQALGKSAKLFSLPVPIINIFANMIGKKESVQRLCGSLQADISKTKELLGWEPPISLEEGLRRATER